MCGSLASLDQVPEHFVEALNFDDSGIDDAITVTDLRIDRRQRLPRLDTGRNIFFVLIPRWEGRRAVCCTRCSLSTVLVISNLPSDIG
jgi:hypothetical protein